MNTVPIVPTVPTVPAESIAPKVLMRLGMLSAALMLLMSARPSFAVYRCDADGKISYSDRPCRDAATMPIDAPQASRNRPNADQQQTRQAAELARLQQLRELRERQDQRIRDLAARGAAARDKKCRALALQLRWREEDVRDAPLEKEARARKQLRRTEERYRDACR